MKNTKTVSEDDIRLFFDAADRLLQAAEIQSKTAEQHCKTAEEATSALLQASVVH